MSWCKKKVETVAKSCAAAQLLLDIHVAVKETEEVKLQPIPMHLSTFPQD